MTFQEIVKIILHGGMIETHKGMKITQRLYMPKKLVSETEEIPKYLDCKNKFWCQICFDKKARGNL